MQQDNEGYMKQPTPDWTETCTRRFMAGFHIPDTDQIPGYAALVQRGLAAPLLSRFDPGTFVAALKQARVQAFWFYNKCHKGNCYYPSAVEGAHLHSGLRGRDLFGEVCEACLQADIVPLCIYEFFDYRVMKDHPDWCCRVAAKDHSAAFLGEEHGALSTDDGDVKTGRPCLCGPYADFALAQAVETVRRYPVRAYYVDFLGALHFDCWLCPRCNGAFRQDFGYDFPGVAHLPRDAYMRYVRWHYRRYDRLARRFRKALNRARPDILFVHNTHAIGHTPNLQSWDRAAANADFLTGDLFALGGTLPVSWVPRAYRAVSRRRPEVLLDTQHGRDRWNPKALDGYRAETWTARAQDAALCSSVCMAPDGSWNPACLALAREIFVEQEACEPWMQDREPIYEAALVHSQPSADFAPRDPAFPAVARHELAFEGWAQALLQAHVPWDVLHDFQLDPGHLKRYRLVILPEVSCLEAAAVRALRDYVQQGGRLIITGATGLYNGLGRARRTPALAGLAGIQWNEPPDRDRADMGLDRRPLKPEHSWEPSALRFKTGQALVRAGKQTRVLGFVYERLSQRPTAASGCTLRRQFRGQVMYWAGDPGLEYRTGGVDAFRAVMTRALECLRPRRPAFRIEGVGTVEVTAYRQPRHRRMVLHLVQSVPGLSRSATLMRTIHSPSRIDSGPYHKIEEVGAMPPAADLLLRLPFNPRRPAACIYLAPEQRRLRPRRVGNELQVTLPPVHVHTLVVIEEECSHE